MKAFIFDLDGVIVDTAKFHELAWNKIAEELDIEFSAELNERLKGVSRVRCLEILLENSGQQLSNEKKEEILNKKNQYYLNYIDNISESELLPGVMDLFKRAKQENIHICLGSASKNATFILDKLNITNYFDVVVDGNSVENAKPDPEVFIKSCETLNIKPEQCVVFEDSIAGILAANNAGMYSVGVGKENGLNIANEVHAELTTYKL